MDSIQWYVIQTKPKKETQVYNYLLTKGVDVYYPCVRVKPVNPRASKLRPYFPRYIFVHVDLEAAGEGLFQWLPGAVGLVRFGDEPARVQDHYIHELKRRIDQIRTAGGLHLDGLKRGDRVRITSGPFAGYEAIFDDRLSGEERARVLLQWLGRQLAVTVNTDAIARTGR